MPAFLRLASTTRALLLSGLSSRFSFSLGYLELRAPALSQQ
jgi:hypothetical protein